MSATVAPWRRIHLLDLENLLGGWVTCGESQALFGAYEAAVRVGPHDQVIVGTAHRHAPFWIFQVPWTHQSVLGADVPDGADAALLDAVTPMRWGSGLGLVLGSGDHAFAPLAEQVRAAGGVVELVVGQGHPARRLVAAASRVTQLVAGFPPMAVAA